MELLPTIEDMIARLARAASPDRIILFGSYARGEAGDDSDVDLLVLFKSLSDRRAMVTRLYEAVNGMDLAKDIVAATIDEFERYRVVSNTIYQAAAQHGIKVYEKNA